MSVHKKNKLLFFARVSNKEILSDVSFYEQDIRALREMGFEVEVSISFKDLFFRKYDVLYVWWWTYSLLPILLSFIKGAKCVVAGAFHFQTPLMSGTDFVRRTWLYRLLIGCALRTADMNIFVSKCEYDAVVNNLSVRCPKLVYHGIDTDLYRPLNSLESTSDVCAEAPVLLCISWMEKNNIERKCIREVVQALEILHSRGIDAKLLLIGRPGPGYEEFLAFVSTMKCAKNIEFKGHVTEAEKISLLRGATIYVSPTLYEGFGIAIAESMSTGCPVITSANGAVPEVVGRCGLLVDPLDPSSIAKAVEYLLMNPENRRRLGALGRRRIISRFSYSKHSQRLAEVMRSLDN